MSGARSWKKEVGVLVILLAVAGAARLPGLFSRSIWYDEAISLLETAGHTDPVWPHSPTPASVAKANLSGTPTLGMVLRDIRTWDTHPPAYFLVLTMWRQWLGFSLETSRWLSLIFSLGSVLLLYALLRTAEFEYPVGATVFYALSTGGVHHGHEARPYAMAEVLLLASCLAAVWAWKRSAGGRSGALLGTIAMALGAGSAFATDYLVVFPLGALMVWYLWVFWRRNRAIGIIGPLLAVVAGSAVLPILRQQLGARQHQFSGFVGLLGEAREMVLMNAQEMGIALSRAGVGSPETQKALSAIAAVVAMSALVVFSVYWIGRQGWQRNSEFWCLIVALAAAPTAGLVLMDLILGKRLHEARYLAFAVPALAVLLSYGVLSATRHRQRWGPLLFAGLLAIQVARINWGFERCVRDQTGSITRGLVKIIAGVETPSQLVAVAGGFGEGDPAVWAYELEAGTPMLVFDQGTDPRHLMNFVSQAVDLWITFSSDKATLPVELELVKRLEESGDFIVVFRNRAAIHLIRGSGV